MHTEARNFTLFVKNNLSRYFKDVKVLDVGGGDINGNNRFLFDSENPNDDSRNEYHCNDVVNAPNVTIVGETRNLPFEDEYFDVIVSTECFEYDKNWQESVKKIYKMLKRGGLFFHLCVGWTTRTWYTSNNASR
jgi:SAM-dependent methyltransferase